MSDGPLSTGSGGELSQDALRQIGGDLSVGGVTAITEEEATLSARTYLADGYPGIAARLEPTLHLYTANANDSLGVIFRCQAVWIARYAGIPPHGSSIDEPAPSGTLEDAFVVVDAQTGEPRSILWLPAESAGA
jgi:hypothetical protein